MRNDLYFVNEVNYNNVSLEADLRCECGEDTFFIKHSGAFRKGLFGGATILKKNKQLIIKCNCTKCMKEFLLFDSTKDGVNPKGTPLNEFSPLNVKDENTFAINLKYNFLKEKYKSDSFEMFFMDIKSPQSKKYIRIYEY